MSDKVRHEQRIAAIVVAGGSGSRFGSEIPKQFMKLRGYPLYIWTLSKVYSALSAADIILTVPTSYIDAISEECQVFGERVRVIAGGASRQESVYLALCALKTISPDFVLVHDAARPFVSENHLREAVHIAKSRASCTIALPVTDTIKEVNEGKIVHTVDRSVLWSVQTPQAAPFNLLLDCHVKARKENVQVTDDAAILEHYGQEVLVFEGSTGNIKVTRQEDFTTCQLLAPLYLSEKPI